LIAVACSQFQKLKATILDTSQEQITPHQRQEDEQIYKIANSKLQAKLNAWIRHHQNIMA
jgi:molybdopterin biosynthesis enzyme